MEENKVEGTVEAVVETPTTPEEVATEEVVDTVVASTEVPEGETLEETEEVKEAQSRWGQKSPQSGWEVWLSQESHNLLNKVRFFDPLHEERQLRNGF